MSKIELLTTKEVAKYLKINEKKVYQLIKEGKIPCTRVAGKWLFPKNLIDKWIIEGVEKRKDILIAGSNDPFLNMVINQYTRKYFPDSLIYYASIGSAKGLIALAQGKALIASIHLFHPETQEYNIPYLSKYLGSEKSVLVNLAYREQGFIVKKGNPLGIKSFEDLKRNKIKIINRNKGSGTRLLLDYYLKRLNINPEKIRGYENEVNTHLEVGLSVLKGNADVGIGIRYIAEFLGLDFIPIAWERFDLVILKDNLYIKPIRNFLAFLDPLNINLFSQKLAGYDLKDTGKIIFEG